MYKPERYSGSYSFVPAGIERSQKANREVNVVFVVFDVWGDRMRNLGRTQVLDYPESGTVSFEGSWLASENDVSEFYTRGIG